MRGEKLFWDKGAWPYEGGGYWFEGLAGLGYALHDEELLQQLNRRMDVIVNNMNANGLFFLWWLERNNPEDRKAVLAALEGWPLWASGLLGRAMALHYAGVGDKKILKALEMAYGADPDCLRWIPGNLSNLWPAYDTYTWTGNPVIAAALDAMCREEGAGLLSNVNRYRNPPDLTPGATVVNAHVVEFVESTTPWAVGYLWTGQTNYLRAAVGWHDLIDRISMQPHGVPVSDEWYLPTGAFRGSETCDVANYIWSQAALLSVTGEGRMADRLERAFFNAGPATVSRDYRTHVYFQSPNRMVDGAPDFPHGPRAGGGSYRKKHSPLCCTAALNRILPNYVNHMWMATYDNGLAAVCYGPCKVTALAADRVPVEIVCLTGYPFNEEIEVTVKPAKHTTFPLYFRMPGWCKNPELSVNGSAVGRHVDANGFVCLSRTWRPGDVVRLRFPMTAVVATGRDNAPLPPYKGGHKPTTLTVPGSGSATQGMPYAAVSYGPLLFALAIPDTADANTPAPSARWKYALDIHAPELSVERSPMPDKWNWPLASPLKIKVNAVGIDWHPESETPKLPDFPVASKNPREKITLIPYGCTKFRVSMFPVTAEPEVKDAGSSKILFLGNSITLHGPAPAIGWSNNWGMAASAVEKDYVHIVTRGIERETGRKAEVRVKNLADFERNYRTWNIQDGLKDLVAFDPDYLVIALGENAPNLATEDDRLAYRKAFENLLGVFMKGRMTRPNVVVRGVFWPHEAKDYEMAHAASDFAVPFVKTDCAYSLPGMSAAGLFTHGGVAGHPGDKGMAEIAKRILNAFFPSESGYEVRMDGKPVKVRPIRISAMPFNQWAPGYQRPVDQTEIAGMVTVEVDGPAQFRVMPARLFKKAVVRPLSKGVKPETMDRVVTFTIPGPGYYVLELDGYHCPLEIFADPKRDFAAEKAEANIVFGPGRHEPVIVKLKSHDRVYIDKDAFVLGSFQVDGVEDVKISGYGVICGSRSRRDTDQCYREGQASPIRVIDSKRVTVDGPVVIDSSCWCVEAFNSSDIELAHLKVAGAWRYNTDGIDICNSQRVRIRDSFIHSFDDTIALKGIFTEKYRDDPVADIKVERCVCWCGWGRTLEIGYETWAPYFRNIVFEDCDLIHNNGAALSVHLGGPAPVGEITFRNIRVECDASELQSQMQSSRDQKYFGKAPNQFSLISITNDKMFSPGSLYAALGYDSKNDPYGTFKRVMIEDVDVSVDEGACVPTIHIQPEQGTAFGEIKVSGVRINGKEVDVVK